MEFKLTAKQTLMFQSTANEIFFGGAGGGGKTQGNKILAVAVAFAVPGVQIAILRNTSKNLKKNYLQGNNSLPSMLYEWIKIKEVSINYTDLTVNFQNGSIIHMMHAENVEATIENLHGLELGLIIADEASLLDSRILKQCKSRLRLGSLKVDDPFWKERLPRFQATSNPGGISHSYLKKKYIDPAPPMTEFKDENGKRILFIPAFAEDNPHVDHEAYDMELRSMDDPVKYAQMAKGDWDSGGATFFGDAFDRQKNVIPDFELPKSWRCYRAYDPGYSSPFGYVIMAKVKGENEIEFVDGTKKYIPNGSWIVYREWYGSNGKDANVGLRWTHEEIVEVIVEKEISWGLRGRILPGKADWKIWDGELNVYSTYEKANVTFTKADKAKGSRKAGALKMRRMMFNACDTPIEKPALFFVDKCVHCISTIPTLPTDPDDPDDVVTEGVPDHLYDAVRYQIMSDEKFVSIVKTVGL